MGNPEHEETQNQVGDEAPHERCARGEHEAMKGAPHRCVHGQHTITGEAMSAECAAGRHVPSKPNPRLCRDCKAWPLAVEGVQTALGREKESLDEERQVEDVVESLKVLREEVVRARNELTLTRVFLAKLETSTGKSARVLVDEGWPALPLSTKLHSAADRAVLTAALLVAILQDLHEVKLERAPRLGSPLGRISERLRRDGETLRALAELVELPPGEVPPHLAELAESVAAIVPSPPPLEEGANEGELAAAAMALRPQVEALGAELDGWNAHLGLWEASVHWNGLRPVLRKPTGELLLEVLRRFNQAKAASEAAGGQP